MQLTMAFLMFKKNWVIRIDGDLIYHDSLIPGIKDFYLLLNALTNIYSLKII